MSKIGAIILAAGFSNRMGKPKLLLPYKEKPLIYYPVALATKHNLQPIILVSGIYHEQLLKALQPFENKLTIITNELAEEGMSTSLKKGIEAIETEVDACFLFLGDQPFVTDEVIRELLKVYRENQDSGIKIVRPCYQKKPGHPILIDKSLFTQFKQLKGDQGGKMILKKYKEQLKYINFDNPLWGADIDTPKDYADLIINQNEGDEGN